MTCYLNLFRASLLFSDLLCPGNVVTHQVVSVAAARPLSRTPEFVSELQTPSQPPPEPEPVLPSVSQLTQLLLSLHSKLLYKCSMSEEGSRRMQITCPVTNISET